MSYKLLVINPGSTSTKVAVYEDRKQLWMENIQHDQDEVSRFKDIYSQLDWRSNLVKKCYEGHGDKIHDFDAIVARGGLMPPVHSGAYEVNEYMIDCLHYRPQNQHASNLGAPIAANIAKQAGVKAYIYDAVAVDEMEEIYRYTGLKEAERYGRGHNLNMRAAVLNFCEKEETDYKEKVIISVHLGGGISVGLFENGKIVDMISDDEGPFSPERAGGISAFKIVDLCYDKYSSKSDVMKHLQREGGLVSHIGTTDLREVEAMIEKGDTHAKMIYDAMALNVAKNIAKLAVDTCGKVDYIILTGGMAFSKPFTDEVRKRVEFIAPVKLMPGEKEMDSLAFGALRVLNGQEEASLLLER